MTRRSESDGMGSFGEVIEMQTRSQVRREQGAATAKQGTSLSQQFEQLAASMPDVAWEYQPQAVGTAMLLRGQIPDGELDAAVRARLTQQHGDEWRAREGT